jgi:hypothetical protein
MIPAWPKGILMNSTLRVYEPVALTVGGHAPRRTIDRLEGRTIGFIDNGKPNFNWLVDDLADVLQAKYGVRTVVKRRKRGASVPAPEVVMKEIAGQCTAVVTGSGD